MANIIGQILGVRGYDLATRRGTVVTPANFTIGGIMGQFQRKFKQAFPVSSLVQFQTIFGGYFSSAAYGPDVVADFFNNLAGTPGTAYIASYVGNSAGTVDALVAGLQLVDTEASPLPLVQLQAGYQGVLQYGVDGNTTGVTVESGTRFSTTVTVIGTILVGSTGTTVIGSNQVTSVTGAPTAALIGDSITGLNIPAGTTILNVIGTTFTISQNATGSATLTALTVTQINFALASTADIEVGDCVKIAWTGGTPSNKGFIVTAINQSTNTITIAGTGLAVSQFTNIGDVVSVPGFRIHTWRTNSLGQAVEVDTDLGKTWCTWFTAVADHFVGNVFGKSNYLVVAAMGAAPADPQQANIAALAVITNLTAGFDGTQANTAASWANTLALFTGMPVRFLTNAETSVSGVQIAGETYCSARWDSPCWIYLFSANQSLAQGVVSGNGYQRAGKVSGLSASLTWGYKSDPYNTSSVAPYRAVPPVGAMMGLAIRMINKYGIHYTYGISQEPLIGWQDVYGFQAPDDGDRTTLAQAGVNVIQNLSGSGIVLRNSFTPSSTIDYLWVNSLIMGNYIKVSCQGSLQSTENFPLTYAKLQADRSAIDNFMRLLWASGSTGNAPEGETFGQTIVQSADGSQTYSTYEQSVSVEANLVNNPQSSLQAGNEQIWIFFMKPAPAQSIRIGVGIQLVA